MTIEKNHYVYLMVDLLNGKQYIGKRSCEGPIEEDTDYPTSSEIVKPLFEEKPFRFKKSILGTYKTEEEAYAAEARFCTWKEANSDLYYNKAPGGKGFQSGKANINYGKVYTSEEKRNLRLKNPNRILIVINGKSYDSLSEMEQYEDISKDAVLEAIHRNEKTARNKDGKVFNINYHQGVQERTKQTGVLVEVNGTPYFSARHASEKENIHYTTILDAMRAGKTVARNIYGETFNLKYEEGVLDSKARKGGRPVEVNGTKYVSAREAGDKEKNPSYNY